MFHRLASARDSGVEERATSRRELALSQTWILYHLTGAMAQRTANKHGNRVYASGVLDRVALDLHHFVLVACDSCYRHHREYLDTHPIKEANDYERWVFDMHNSVNRRLGKSEITDFDAVRDHYRAQLELVGYNATATVISAALPVTVGRYCYNC